MSKLLRSVTTLLFLLCAGGFSSAQAEQVIAAETETPAATARIKRLAIQVPNLDQGIAFFQDVLGFSLDMSFTLPPGADPYLPLVFNIEHQQPLRLALFSTSSEPRGLFLLEMPGMRVPDAAEPVQMTTVIETTDLAGIQKRAEEAGYWTAEPQSGETPDGGSFSEMMVVGPASLRVLVFQYH